MLDMFRKATPEALESINEEKRVRGADEVFLLFAMGSQFDHLIVQALSRQGVYCLVADPASVTADDVRIVNPIGIVLSGGPASVHSEPPPFDNAIFDLGIPVLGICLGFQMWARHVGATVSPSRAREFGVRPLEIIHRDDKECSLLDGLPASTLVLQSHGDRIEAHPALEILASTEHAPVAAARHHHLHGVQFHPEVSDTECGARLFANFCFRICCAARRGPHCDATVQMKIVGLREQIGDKRVLVALSGGCDSSVVAYLLRRALEAGAPNRLHGIYIKGIDRPEDEAFVRKHFGNQPWIELKIVDATEKMLDALRDKCSMSEKREAMRIVYAKILSREAQEFKADFLAQGTLYTDISESGGGHATGARKAKIKQHHNVGLDFGIPELTPLADCVKNGVREIGRALGVPEELLIRHPFPGPGLLVRIEGMVCGRNLAVARQADGIWIEELRRAGLYDKVWQAGATVLASQASVTKGDDSGAGDVVCLWAVWSVNGFTAQAAELPYEVIIRASRRITDEIYCVGSVVYRMSDKPPTTIEWG